MFEIRTGDCLDVLRGMADSSVDSIVTDPPYGLTTNKKGGSGVASINLDTPYGRARIGVGNGAGGFMGLKWDSDVPPVEVWAECLRVLKPGGHLLAFAGTRTQHRMAVRIEDAGFEIRDMIAWVYGSGFPKSLDVSKAIDKAAGAEREVIGSYKGASNIGKGSLNSYITTERGRATDVQITVPATPAAQQWAGWGTALKPALEPITVARKPLVGTVAENVLQHGTGAINVDGCRVGTEGGTAKGSKPQGAGNGIYGAGLHGACEIEQLDAGRWPANLIHDGSEEVVGLFPNVKAGVAVNRNRPVDGSTYDASSYQIRQGPGPDVGYRDTGSAARFFYCAKASKRDRDEGCEGMPLGDPPGSKRSKPAEGRSSALGAPRANHHPTVKPTDLMRYLCRLVTPPGGLVLDPFAGSGSTGKGALLEGFRFLGIERDPDYARIAQARCAAVQPGLPLSGPPSE